MAEDFKTFMGFTEPEMVQEIVGILTEGKILHNIYDSRKDFNPSFSNSELGKEILIQIRPQDFEKAAELVNAKMPLREEDIDPGHFLMEFNDDELKDVVKRADEWHPFDVKLAKHLLAKKGTTISEEEMKTFQKEHLAEQSKPERIETVWLVLAYISAISVGFFGLLIGWYLASLKKTLPDGSQVYNYGEADRKHGRTMLFLGFISASIMAIYYLKQ